MRLLRKKKVHNHTISAKVKKAREKVVIGIETFDLIGLFRTNHIIAQITIRQQQRLQQPRPQGPLSSFLEKEERFIGVNEENKRLNFVIIDVKIRRFYPKSGVSQIIQES